jgi:hypothetical protein
MGLLTLCLLFSLTEQISTFLAPELRFCTQSKLFVILITGSTSPRVAHSSLLSGLSGAFDLALVFAVFSY